MIPTKLFFILFLAIVVAVCASSISSPEGQAFLEENRQREGVNTLPSGLQYRIITSGEGTISPNSSTTCMCHYSGATISGEVFDSSYNRGKPTTFTPNQVGNRP